MDNIIVKHGEQSWSLFDLREAATIPENILSREERLRLLFLWQSAAWPSRPWHRSLRGTLVYDAAADELRCDGCLLEYAPAVDPAADYTTIPLDWYETLVARVADLPVRVVALEIVQDGAPIVAVSFFSEGGAPDERSSPVSGATIPLVVFSDFTMQVGEAQYELPRDSDAVYWYLAADPRVQAAREARLVARMTELFASCDLKVANVSTFEGLIKAAEAGLAERDTVVRFLAVSLDERVTSTAFRPKVLPEPLGNLADEIEAFHLAELDNEVDWEALSDRE